jgi:hypothetical protein
VSSSPPVLASRHEWTAALPSLPGKLRQRVVVSLLSYTDPVPVAWRQPEDEALLLAALGRREACEGCGVVPVDVPDGAGGTASECSCSGIRFDEPCVGRGGQLLLEVA